MMRTLTPVFSIVIAVLLFFFFVSPEYNEIKGLKEDTEMYKRAVESYNDFYAKVDTKLAVKRNESPVIVERLNQFIPKDLDVAYNIADLENMAQAHKMLFGNVSTDVSGTDLVSESDKGQELQIADISFDAIGTYEQFQLFLLDLESSLSLFEVTSINFSASEGPFEQFTIAVRTYALPKDN
jgi:hypothetical protein